MTIGTAERPIKILLVEANPGDVALTHEMLKDSDIETAVDVATDGEEAMAYLRKEGTHESAPRPDLILMDLKLPRKDGLGLLRDINADSDLSTIPVIILTGTEAERGLLESYGVPPNRYFGKPIDVGRFTSLVNVLRSGAKMEPIKVATADEEAQVAEAAKEKKWWWPFG